MCSILVAGDTSKDEPPIRLMANYFKINTVPDWALRQYRVDIAPEEDRTFIRKKLLGMHRERLQGYLFDGTVLYTSRPLTSKQVSILKTRFFLRWYKK